MNRTRVFGSVAAVGAALALTFAASGPVSAEAIEDRIRPEGSTASLGVDADQADDTEQANCAALTDRTQVRVRAEPSLDGAVFDYMEPGMWYWSACDSTPGGQYGGACGDGFHWLEVYIGDTSGYVALMCLDGWVEVDV